MHDLFFAFWFMLPAATANTAPIFAARIPRLKDWNAPIDSGRKLHGKPVLGSHKTWRGLISGVVVATVAFGIQQLLVEHWTWLAHTINSDYMYRSVWLLGPLFGIGALGGDAIESFYKRRHNVPSGEKWLPFDQLDYVVGTLLITLPVVRLTLIQYVLILIVWFGMHLLGTYVGWKLGLKDEPI